jgi:hypothetical protein
MTQEMQRTSKKRKEEKKKRWKKNGIPLLIIVSRVE